MTSPIGKMPKYIFEYMSKYLKENDLANLSAVSKVARASLNAAWKAVATEQLHIEKLQHPENARADVEEFYDKRNTDFLLVLKQFTEQYPSYAEDFSALANLPKNPLAAAEAIETFIKENPEQAQLLLYIELTEWGNNRRENTNGIETLISTGIKPNASTMATAMHLSRDRPHHEFFQKLMSLGGVPGRECIDRADKEKNLNLLTKILKAGAVPNEYYLKYAVDEKNEDLAYLFHTYLPPSARIRVSAYLFAKEREIDYLKHFPDPNSLLNTPELFSSLERPPEEAVLQAEDRASRLFVSDHPDEANEIFEFELSKTPPDLKAINAWIEMGVSVKKNHLEMALTPEVKALLQKAMKP